MFITFGAGANSVPSRSVKAQVPPHSKGSSAEPPSLLDLISAGFVIPTQAVTGWLRQNQLHLSFTVAKK